MALTLVSSNVVNVGVSIIIFFLEGMNNILNVKVHLKTCRGNIKYFKLNVTDLIVLCSSFKITFCRPYKEINSPFTMYLYTDPKFCAVADYRVCIR